jgi:hypothetical protein
MPTPFAPAFALIASAVFSIYAQTHADGPPPSSFYASVSPTNGLDLLGVRIVHISDDGQSASIIADERWRTELPARGYSVDIIKWYGPRSPAYQKGTKSWTLANESVAITVNASGAFTIQRASDSKWLLYPNPDTTAFSVRVDSNVYWTRNGSLRVTTPLTVLNSTSAYIEYTTPENIVIRHTFDLVGDAIKFTVQARNAGPSSRSVQVRYLFDTQIDVNDGSPLYAQGVTDSQGSPVCTYETDIPNVSFGSWRGYDIWPNPGLTSIGTVSTTPNRMVFAWWPRASKYAWDYAPNPNQRFYTPGYTTSPYSDSCVLIYFDLGTIGAGGSRFVSTFYGIGVASGSDPMQDFSLAIAELRSRYLAWAEGKVEIAAKAFAKGIYALQQGEDSERKRSAIGLAVSIASIGVNAIDSASLAKQLTDAGFKLSPGAVSALDVLDFADKLFDFADFDLALIGTFTPGSLTESHLTWVAEHKDDLLSNWNEQQIAQEYKRFLWEKVTWGESESPKGFKTLCETMCDTSLSSLEQSVASNNAADYPLAAAAEKLRSIANAYRNDRTLVVCMNDDGQIVELSNERDWIAALDKAIEKFNSAQDLGWGSTWFSVATLGAKVGLLFVTSGWAAVAEVLVTAASVANSIADWTVINSRLAHAEDKLGNQIGMSTLIAKTQVSNGGQVLNLSSKYLDYLNHSQLNSSLGVDNSKVTLADLAIVRDITVRRGETADLGGLAIVTIRNDADNQVPVQAHVPIYAKRSDGNWLFVTYAFTPVGLAPANGYYRSFFNSVTLGPQEDLNAEKYVAVGYVGVGPAIKSRIVGGLAEEFNVRKANWWRDFGDSVRSFFRRSNAHVGTQDSYLFTPRQDMVVSDILLEWPGSDLDLHVYDEQGRHVGVNYATGDVECDIPGAIYSGPSARPEWVRLPNAAVGACQLRVVANEAQEGGEPYSLIVFETPARPAFLNVSPHTLTNICDVSYATSASFVLAVSEMGGQQMLESLSAQVTDLVSPNAVIPASAFTIRFSSNNVQAGGTEMLSLDISTIQYFPVGVYTGQVTVTATSGDPSTRALLGGWRGSKGASLQDVVELYLEIRGGHALVDVTTNVSITYNSWTLDRASGAMIASITLSNSTGKAEMPLEKVFWYAITESTNLMLANPTGTTNGLRYVDVTAQVEGQLPSVGNGDLKLDVGESVTITVAFYSRDLSIPTGHVFSIWADPTPRRPPGQMTLSASRDPATGHIRIRITGTPGTVCVVEASSDLVHWEPISSITNVTGTAEVVQEALQHRQRYYRVRSQ